MANCVFEIRRGLSRVIGVQQVDPRAEDPWTSLRDSLQRCADRYKLGPQTANDSQDEEMIVTVGVLDMLMRGTARAGASLHV
jgi:hypothetical protein